MSSGLLIRDFRKGDLEGFLQCLRKSFVEEFEVRGLDPDFWRKMARRTSLMERIIHLSTDRKFLAVRGEKVVGYVRSSYTSAKEAGAIRLYVSSEMPLEEIVEILVQSGLDHIKSIGTKTVLTTVSSTKQELIHELKKMGFEERLAMEGMVLEFQ